MNVSSFAPIYDNKSHTLILGSMPGVKSLDENQYYAHPRNAFWAIMQALYGVDRMQAYPQRCSALVDAGVALWDVLAQCHRPGSLDSAIDKDTAVANDIAGLLLLCPQIQVIGLNGGAAAKLFKKHVLADLPRDVRVVELPSTSPAYAAINTDEKQRRWAQALGLELKATKL